MTCDLRIKKIELFKVPPRWLFLKMTTEGGLVGWGEPVVEGKADSVAAAVKELGDQLIGHSAADIEDACQIMYRCGFYRGGPVLTSAMSGIEQAMWDIKGKYLGVPVYELLGGKVRDRIQVYRWVGGDHPRDVVTEAGKAVAQGYKAVKMNGTDELRWVDSYDKLDACVERVAAIRENYPKLGIAVDFHGRVHKTMARLLMKKLEPYDLMFVEEPVLCENEEEFARLRAASCIPLATGERNFTRWGFKSMLINGGVDIIQPDVSHCGGIWETRKIAAMAEAFDVSVAPTVLWAPSLWLPALRWTSALPMPSFRSRAPTSTTMRATICSTTLRTVKFLNIRTVTATSGILPVSAWRWMRTMCVKWPRKATTGTTPSGATRTAV